MNREDVWMVQGAGGLRFLLKTRHALLIGREIGRQNFDRNLAADLRIESQIHFSHSALSDLRADFVATEFCAGSESHFFRAAVQFRMTVGRGDLVSPISVPTRKRWPSWDTANS